MKSPLVICAVSGSRADYGLLVEPMRAISSDRDFSLKLVLTGQHLVRSAGDTGAQARLDGFDVAAEVNLKLSGDDPVTITKAAGRALDGMADVLEKLSPDLVLLLGDRYEILSVAIAATIARIPIAHIAGGDVTEGAIDDAFRHAITKMAHVHFVTNEDARRRVMQLGESADRIHVVGSPGLDLVRKTRVTPRDDFFSAIGLTPRKTNLLVTFHPETISGRSIEHLDELLAALKLLPDCGFLFTGSNADPDGRQIDARLGAFVAQQVAARFIPSLGTERFFAALTHMDGIVGNSSSGLYEAPSFGIPTVNIGDRQKGRLKASSVFDCAPERVAIHAAIMQALARGRKPTMNPYGDGHATERIMSVLRTIGEPGNLFAKRFVDVVAA